MGLTRIIPPRGLPVDLVAAKDQLYIVGDDTQDNILHAYIAAATDRVERSTRRSLLATTWELTLDVWPREIILPQPPLMKVESIQFVSASGGLETLDPSNYVVDRSGSKARIAPTYGVSWPVIREGLGAVRVRYVAGYAVPFEVVEVEEEEYIIKSVDHPLEAGQRVRLSNSGGELPSGLDTNTDYYIVDVSDEGFVLATEPHGPSVDVTDTGTGSHFVGIVPESLVQAILIYVAHLHAHREPVVAGMGLSVMTLPFSVDALIGPYRVVEVA